MAPIGVPFMVLVCMCLCVCVCGHKTSSRLCPFLTKFLWKLKKNKASHVRCEILIFDHYDMWPFISDTDFKCLVVFKGMT